MTSVGDEILHPGLWEAFAAYIGPDPEEYFCLTCGESFTMAMVG